MPSDAEQALLTITHVRRVLDAIVLRGTRSVTGEQLRELNALGSELKRIGAAHIATLLATVAEQIESGDASAAGELMRAISQARVLDRLLTLRFASATYAAATEDANESR